MKLAVQKSITTYLICVTLLAVTTIGLGILLYNINKKDDPTPDDDIVQAIGNAYIVSFYEFDGTWIQDKRAEEGELLSALAPKRESLGIPVNDAQYTYKYEGRWSTQKNADTGIIFTDSHKVTAPASYYVAYAKVLNSYNVTFKADINDDGDFEDTNETTITPQKLEYGTLPSAPAAFGGNFWKNLASPDTENPLQFNGWDKAISAVTGETTYTAMLEPVHYFTLKYAAADGSGVIMTTEPHEGLLVDMTWSVKYKKTTDTGTTEVTETFNRLWRAEDFIDTIEPNDLTLPAPYYTVSRKIVSPLPRYSGAKPKKASTEDPDTGVETAYAFWQVRESWTTQWVTEDDKLVYLWTPNYSKVTKKYRITWVDYYGAAIDYDDLPNRDSDISTAYPERKAVPHFAGTGTDAGKGYVFHGEWELYDDIATDIIESDFNESVGLTHNIIFKAKYRDMYVGVYDSYVKALGSNASLKNANIDDVLWGLYSMVGGIGDPDTLEMDANAQTAMADPNIKQQVSTFFLGYGY